MSDIDTMLMSHDIKFFVQQCHNIIHGRDLDDSPYLNLLYDAVEDITAGREPRLIINLPPGVGKSFVMSVCLSAWYVSHHPSAKVIITQHNEKLATDAVRNVRKILKSPLYQKSFKTRIDPRLAASGYFGTTDGGSVYAASVAGSITGERADLVIIDDPVPIKHAKNLEHLEKINAQYDAEIASRARGPDSCFVLIMHRLNRNDLTAHLLAKGEYELLAVPLVAEESTDYVTTYGEWHRAVGEQIRPGRYSRKQLKNLKTEPLWDFLYQQGIGKESSVRISEADFILYEWRPDRSIPFVFSVDPGLKGGPNSSRSVIQVWQVKNGLHCLVDLFAERCDYEGLLVAMKSMIRHWPPSAILIEDTANGSALISQLKNRVTCDVYPVVPKKSKYARMAPHLVAIKRGLIGLPMSANWASDWISDMSLFPGGDGNDNVDAFSMMMDFMRKKPHLEPAKQNRGLLSIGQRGTVQSIERSFGVSKKSFMGIVTASSMKKRRF